MLWLAAWNQSLSAVSASRFSAVRGTADTRAPSPSKTARDTKSSRFSSYRRLKSPVRSSSARSMFLMLR